MCTFSNLYKSFLLALLPLQSTGILCFYPCVCFFQVLRGKKTCPFLNNVLLFCIFYVPPFLNSKIAFFFFLGGVGREREGRSIVVAE